MKISVFWDNLLAEINTKFWQNQVKCLQDMVSCSPYGNQRLRGTYHLHLQGKKSVEQETSVQQVPGPLWRYRWSVPPKRRFTYRLHAPTSQKMATFTTATVRISNPTFTVKLVWHEWVQQSFVRNNVSACFIKHVYHNMFWLKSKPSSGVIVYRILNASY
jgi:hypothetical protein